MRRSGLRHRVARGLMWCCIGASVMLIVIAAVSTRLSFFGMLGVNTNRTAHILSVEGGAGCVRLQLDDLAALASRPRMQLMLDHSWDRFGWTWWPRSCWGVTPGIGGFGTTSRYLDLPIWLVFFSTVAMAVFFWKYAGRRPVTGHCSKCGYDLTGLAAPTCPECGCRTPPDPSATMSAS